MYLISNLTEFNHALVYGFDPESFPSKLFSEPSIEDLISGESEQHVDILNAYLYAQNEILPKIQEQGLEKVAAAQLLTWLLTLHKHIGKSLLASYDQVSGHYTTEEVDRWQQNSDSAIEIFDFIQSLTISAKVIPSFVKNYSNKHGLSQKTCKIFAHMVYRFVQDSVNELPEPLIPGRKSYPLIMSVMGKIRIASRQGGLSVEEQEELNKIIIFGSAVEEIPESMQSFAEKTLQTWRGLVNQEDIFEIATQLAEIFYQLAHIHPFVNCNGRTATCLINIILKSIGLPDLILRFPGERNKANTDYEKAMASIMKSRELFAKHIFKCIINAQEKPFQDPELASLIELRVILEENYKNLQRNPVFNKQNFLRKMKAIQIYVDDAETTILKKILLLVEQTAIELVRPSQSQLTTLSTPTNPLSLYKEGLGFYQDQKYNAAIDSLKLAINGFQVKTGEFSVAIATCYSTLASTYRDKKEFNCALEASEKAFICLEKLNKDTETIAVKYSNCLSLAQQPAENIYKLAVSNYKEKHFHTALSQLDYCLKKWQLTPGSNSLLASCYSTIASCQRELGLIQEALATCDLALELCTKAQQSLIQAKREALEAVNNQIPKTAI